VQKLNKMKENLEANIVPNRMDNESHQLGSFRDLNLPPHDAGHLILRLRDGGRHHEPHEVGQEDHVEDDKAQEEFSSKTDRN